MMSDSRPDALQRRATELREQSVLLTVHAVHLRVQAGLEIARAQALQQSVLSYAEAMRDLGEPAHRTIEHVRLLADEALSAAARTGARPPLLRDLDAVIDQLVLWAVDAYVA